MKRRNHQNLEEQLGGEILHVFHDILSDPNLIETLRLYMGADVGSITILELDDPELEERFIIDTEGRLVYTCREKNVETPRSTRLFLLTTYDFNDLSLESTSQLHSAVTRDDFLDRLAWRIGREGKPGYRSSGYDEERDTWRIKSADPDEHTQRRITNRRRLSEGDS